MTPAELPGEAHYQPEQFQTSGSSRCQRQVYRSALKQWKISVGTLKSIESNENGSNERLGDTE